MPISMLPAIEAFDPCEIFLLGEVYESGHNQSGNEHDYQRHKAAREREQTAAGDKAAL